MDSQHNGKPRLMKTPTRARTDRCWVSKLAGSTVPQLPFSWGQGGPCGISAKKSHHPRKGLAWQLIESKLLRHSIHLTKCGGAS